MPALISSLLLFAFRAHYREKVGTDPLPNKACDQISTSTKWRNVDYSSWSQSIRGFLGSHLYNHLAPAVSSYNYLQYKIFTATKLGRIKPHLSYNHDTLAAFIQKRIISSLYYFNQVSIDKDSIYTKEQTEQLNSTLS